MLGVSGGDNVVKVFKEQPDGRWEMVSQINEEGIQM